MNSFLHLQQCPAFFVRFISMVKSKAGIAQKMLRAILNKSCKGARGVMVIVVGNGHNDTSSNPGRG